MTSFSIAQSSKSQASAKATVLYQALGRIIATRTGTDTTYLRADHLGSTVGTVSADGSEVHQVRYWLYGKVRSGDSSTDKMYTGQQMEAGSALGAVHCMLRLCDVSFQPRPGTRRRRAAKLDWPLTVLGKCCWSGARSSSADGNNTET
jgi:hypothetical protein